ncbi:hypothetical protein M378DRAFT_158117 [Amanita muscaria Koide BX008]|uniref:Uncharacterized protein n=1 Tax=Amanita muscaria (strain Koide BX008) TaxID=946122 RepID=A0A0C2X427_AMAMK|nr:hypothetical protein M378DRAFT_158117 [Amanita muscaria Koide BX008]
MADALKPWIGKYLLDIAEQYGAQLYKAPAEQKSKKVQLVQVMMLLIMVAQSGHLNTHSSSHTALKVNRPSYGL